MSQVEAEDGMCMFFVKLLWDQAIKVSFTFYLQFL